MASRRAFLRAMGAGGVFARAHVAYGRHGVAPEPAPLYLAYTSFAVRLSQARAREGGVLASMGAPAFSALCRDLGAGGGQIDFSQLPIDDASALHRVRPTFTAHGLGLQVSMPADVLRSDTALEHAVDVARTIGATCARIALLGGRRYESFETAEAWQTFTSTWREALLRRRPTIERLQFPLGIENHKDWLADDLAALLRELDSPWAGCCLDFGNNVALLEDPARTIAVLAPFAVTTHLKDMAVVPTRDGFTLSEVPLGQGLVPLTAAMAELRRVRPDVQLVLEMITRDPLVVPYRLDRYWATFEAAARDRARVRAFEEQVLSRSWSRPLPRVSSLDDAARVAAEDDNIRASMAWARDALHAKAG